MITGHDHGLQDAFWRVWGSGNVLTEDMPISGLLGKTLIELSRCWSDVCRFVKAASCLLLTTRCVVLRAVCFCSNSTFLQRNSVVISLAVYGCSSET